ncbi:MAG: cysteine hydrolase [Candidatus Nanoarchaeia archaeon]|nr:cysteine hydrolase [Candidatus Nanoarchaeia archaeon]
MIESLQRDDCLVVIDYQKDFVDGLLPCNQPAKDIENFIIECVEEFHSINNEGNVIITLDTHEIPKYTISNEGKYYPKHCEKYTEGWLPYGKLKNYMNYTNTHVIEKDTFGSIHLVNYLHTNMKFKNIYVTGVATNVCVLHNVILMYNMLPDVKINVLAKGCASFDETLHKQALKLMEGFVNVIY